MTRLSSVPVEAGGEGCSPVAPGSLEGRVKFKPFRLDNLLFVCQTCIEWQGVRTTRGFLFGHGGGSDVPPFDESLYLTDR